MNSDMNGEENFITFAIDGLRFGVDLSKTERAFRAVFVTPLPGSPDTVLGAVDVSGEIVPVVDLRMKIGLEKREIELTDHFLLVQTKKRRLILVVERIEGILRYSGGHITQIGDLVPGLSYISGVVRDEEGLILINDIEELLSRKEELSIKEALERVRQE